MKETLKWGIPIIAAIIIIFFVFKTGSNIKANPSTIITGPALAPRL